MSETSHLNIYNKATVKHLSVKAAICSGIIAFAAISGISAQAQTSVRWHNEASDTTRITQMLTTVGNQGPLSSNQRIAAFAHLLEGTPYASGTLEGSPEMLTVNLDSLDCTTFVETVAALALTLEEGRNAWQDFIYNLEQLRYRQGHVDGYASRLHYVSDWVVDNTHRGLLTEMTDRLPGWAHQVKTLDYMSRHRNAYPAMADDEVYEKIKSAEVGFRSHRFPVLKSSLMQTKKGESLLKDGDILIFTTKTDGLDASHMGIASVHPDGRVHVIHASSAAGRVIDDPLTLGDYLRKNHSINGIRVIRIGSLR